MKTQKHKFFNLTQLIDEDKVFKYYTMENEDDLATPHIHICVNLNNPIWRGKIFKLLELQLEFNIWDIIKFSVEFFPKSISHWIFGFELYLGIINIIFSLQDNREFT